MLLDDKVCVITGAASARGIGKATAKVFALYGARVAILDLDADAAAAAAADIGGVHRGYACDVTDRTRCFATVDEILRHFGKIDVLVNNAGITQPLKLMEIEPANYDAVLDVSLRGTLNMSQAVVPHFRTRRQGAIVCISSVSAQRGGGLFGGPHYSAAKAGVLGLARAMARELAPEGIRVNSVTPGMINTDITAGKLSQDVWDRIVSEIPLRRLGEAEDVAKACLFLGSDLSSFITGATLDVNGGILIH